MQKLVTIIIPVYNKELYIQKSIESVLSQTYKNLQIIFVDDGSTDNSLNIIKSNKDIRIEILEQNHQGVSAARNLAISRSKGEYIVFHDADDIIDKYAIEKLYNIINTNDCDIVVGDMKLFSTKKAKALKINAGTYNLNDENEFLYCLNNIQRGPCAKMYKKDIIVKNNILFLENINYAEDYIYLCHYLSKCNKLVAINDIIYYYNMDSSLNRPKQNIDYLNCLLTESIEKEKVLKKIIADSVILDEMVTQLYTNNFEKICYLYVLNNNNEKTIKSKLEEAYKIFKNKIKYPKKGKKIIRLYFENNIPFWLFYRLIKIKSFLF